MAQQDQDKTEQPTPYRLQEARKRGEVAKSVDFTASVVMVAFAGVIALTATGAAAALATSTRQMIELAGMAPPLNAGFLEWTQRAYAPVWRALTPLLLALLIAAVLGNLLQTGPVFTTHPLKPDPNRLNPMQTVRRILSLRTLWELGKLLAKLGPLSALCYAFVGKAASLADSVARTNPQSMGALLLSSFIKTSVFVLIVVVLAACADLLFVRREYLRKMRMSRRELKDEIKRRDGDPAVKSKQKQQIRELLKKARALSRVREADVVLTNPTHVAVALQYKPGKMLAPVVLAKGAGMLSQRIRHLAARHGVPLVRVPALARALYKECDIDAPVPPGCYAELGPIYRALWSASNGGLTA